MPVVELERAPGLPALYGRAVAGFLPGRRATGDTVPDTELLLRRVAVDQDRLAEYARVCGFRLGDPLPATYPRLLAFPLALQLMTAPDFPFPAAGVVHIANQVTQHRPLSAAEPLDLAVHAERLQDHPKGRQADLVTRATVDGEEVWREVASYLHRTGGSGARDRAEPPQPPPPLARWRVRPADARAYAAVSGDRNPIHLSRLAARAAGFRSRIAHGMWTKARCLAQLTGRLPDAYMVEVSFAAPLLLPSTVGFSAGRAEGGWDFAVHSQHTGKPHLSGTLRGLAAG